MNGSAKVIDKLNQVLMGELTAINQYFLHARMCQDWGYEYIGNKIRTESIDEMKHAQDLIDRILFLEGLPNLQKLGRLSIGQNVKEIFEADLALEMQAIPLLKEAIEVSYNERDHASRELFEHILVDEEGHVDWIESQLHIINEAGYENYLAEQIKSN